MKGAGRALDQLDRALASAADHIARGNEREAIWYVGEAEKVSRSLRAWLEEQPDHTI